MSGSEERKLQMIQGLRDLADWLETTPEAIVESYRTLTLTHWADEKDEVLELARTSGSFDKQYGGSYMDLIKTFGPVKYAMTIPREEVCEKKVVGTRKVEKRDPELISQVPMIEVDEDIVEWECMPLLAPTDDSE